MVSDVVELPGDVAPEVSLAVFPGPVVGAVWLPGLTDDPEPEPVELPGAAALVVCGPPEVCVADEPGVEADVPACVLAWLVVGAAAAVVEFAADPGPPAGPATLSIVEAAVISVSADCVANVSVT